MSIQIPGAKRSFLHPSSRSFVQQALFVVVGTLVLAVASKIAVPMVPVPITMQTFAVTMIGALYGWRLGSLTVLAWLGEAMMGLPVLAGTSTGLAPFVGPTAGYLIAFPLMAAMVGLLTAKGADGRRPVSAFLLHLAANVLCLALGWAWLAGVVGAQAAWIAGVAPFVIGAILKSALAAAALVAIRGRTAK